MTDSRELRRNEKARVFGARPLVFRHESSIKLGRDRTFSSDVLGQIPDIVIARQRSLTLQ